MVSAFGFLAVIGLGVFIPLLLILPERAVLPQFIVVIAICYLAAFSGTGLKLGSLIVSLLNKISPNERKFSSSDYVELVELAQPNKAQMNKSKRMPFSVTDNTTKPLDEVLLKRS